MKRKILIMTTSKWQEEFVADAERSLAEKIDLYIGNTGNLMFLSGCKYIASLGDNECYFYDWYKMKDNTVRYKEEINEMFDLVICPLANILQCNVQYINDLIIMLKDIKIPIYCIGIGLSCDENRKLSDLVEIIRKPVKELVEIVEHSGGKFACRGYITQEVLEKIVGKESDLIKATGCPSMYQNGILEIGSERKDIDNFSLAFNGRNKDLSQKFIRNNIERYGAIYIDQDEWCDVLYGKGNVEIDALLQKSYYGTKMLLDRKIKLFYRLSTWWQYIHENVDFMFGSRIHGNLITLLAEKPAVVYLPPVADLRVCELAEFFNIPTKRKGKMDLYDVYRTMDYGRFNANFKEKYDAFEKFLVDNNICDGLLIKGNEELYNRKNETEQEQIDYEKLQRSFQELSWWEKKGYELKAMY